MKPLFLTALIALSTWRAEAQGTVNFANGAADVNAPVDLAGAGEAPEGPQWQAELLLVNADGSAKRIGQAVPLQSGNLAGYFFAGLVVVPGVEAGARATFQVRAFDSAGTNERSSNPVTLTLGGGKMPPPNLVGLTTWTLNPLNTNLKITVVQKSVKLSWSSDLPIASLEFTDSLTNPNWSPATETPATVGTSLIVTIPVAAPERYYRLRLN
jgi:hypothetical protein